MKDQHLSDMWWLAPMFLSALSADAFLKILTAIMLEKSVIFVSDNLPLLSSAVLGMQCFLRPFKWSYVQIPILPQSLVDMVEAPMPFLVGLLKSHLQYLPSLSEPTHKLHEDFGENERMIVHISDDVKEVRIDCRHIELPVPQFKDIIEKLAVPFSVLNSSSRYYIYTPTEK
jgi:hypothetical protein